MHHSTLNSYLSKIKEQIHQLTAEQVAQWKSKYPEGKFIDVRESDEVATGIIADSFCIPRGLLEMKIETQIPDKTTPLLLYCSGGNRSTLAAYSLMQIGYTHLASLAGGITAWKNAGLPIQNIEPVDAEFRIRYQRHFSIPEVGEAGQLKLAKAKVLIIGAGGLGCPAALYLAAAGVGTLGLADDDVVDLSNLQRQILHTSYRVGTAKVDSALQTLQALNPKIKYRGYREKITALNVDSILPDYDLVIDGSDNFSTRYLINDACLKHNKPNVHGAIFRFQGQVSVFCTPNGPCYRCLFAEPPPADMAPNCAEAGVLGLLPGVIGTLEATEAIKLILNIGEPLIGTLMTYEALSATFRKLHIQKDPHCLCNLNSKDRTQITYTEYSEICR